MRSLVAAALGIGVLAVSSCTTARTAGVERVRMTRDAGVVRGCAFLGEERISEPASYRVGGPSPRAMDQADDHNHRLSETLAHDLKTRAFDRGGNVVLLGSFTAQPLGRDPAGATALAYRIYRCR
jgi:hypothetical protein